MKPAADATETDLPARGYGALETKPGSLKRRMEMDAEPYRVLVVDDDPAMLDVLRMRLQVWGYEVFLAEDALTGARLAAKESPHAILTDVWLPDASGVDLLRVLTKADPHIPIILMSAHGSVDLAVESMKQGAVDYLTKPLDYRRLKELLAVACSRSDTAPQKE